MMRIIGLWRASLLLAALIAIVAPHEAGAQSLFQSLFGNVFKGQPNKPARATKPAPSIQVSPRHHGTNFAVPGFEYRQPRTRQSYSGGAYRTVCVRTCDGYYFPISGSSSRRRFRKDAEACSARCGGGKLYYLPRHSENMAAMVDLTGRRYDQLKSAFVYRKKLIDGCACRPMPWTAAERARHNRYAYAEEILRLNEQRAEKLREQALASANQPAGRKRKESTELGQDQYAPPDDVAAISKDAEVSGSEPHETTDSAYFAVVKAAIAEGEVSGSEQHADVEAAAQTVSYSPQRAQTAPARRRSKSSRSRKTKRKSTPSAGWSFGGGGKYTWPGDR